MVRDDWSFRNHHFHVVLHVTHHSKNRGGRYKTFVLASLLGRTQLDAVRGKTRSGASRNPHTAMRASHVLTKKCAECVRPNYIKTTAAEFLFCAVFAFFVFLSVLSDQPLRGLLLKQTRHILRDNPCKWRIHSGIYSNTRRYCCGCKNFLRAFLFTTQHGRSRNL